MFILRSLILVVAVLLCFTNCNKEGCTDPEAINYSPDADSDDGSCAKLIKGCTDANAENYNPEAEVGDGSCTYLTNTVTLSFDHSVDERGLMMDVLEYKNAMGEPYSVQTLRYYISDIRFHKLNKEVVRIDTFHYRDIELADTRQLIVSEVPDGEYAYISFIFGLDSIRNKTSSLPNEQIHNNMEWPVGMGGGYHYMKFEGRFRNSKGELVAFNTHTGRLKTQDGVLHENFVHVVLPYSGLTIKGDNWDMQILMNLNEWYRDPYIYSIEAYGPAIMGNQNAQQDLKENGVNAFSIGLKQRKGWVKK